MTIHLGFSCSQHDPSIAVVDDAGRVVFAEANERGLKNKRGWHAPADAFGLIEPILRRYVSDEPVTANLTWSRTALAAVPFLNPLSRGLLAAGRVLRTEDRDPELWRLCMLRHALHRAPSSVEDLLLNLELRLRQQRGFRRRLKRTGWNHQLCHAITACFSSPFEDALCVVIDGMGEGSSTSIYQFRDDRVTKLDRGSLTNFASLGHFYSQLCYAAGFDPEAGEEWKLMGLAAYGRLDENLYASLRPLLRVGDDHLTASRDYDHVLAQVMSRRAKDPMANADFAFTAQRLFEDILVAFLIRAHARWGGDNLILTGGCALNSTANGKIPTSTPFCRLHVPMAPGDDGNAIGAALLGWMKDNPGRSPPRFSSPYLGSELEPEALERLKRFGYVPFFRNESPEQLAETLASELATGAIIALARGRAEFGHRALGGRSILADPRPHDIRGRINSSVKFREGFRPFAPSILHEHGPDYFKDYAISPYMERTLQWMPGRAPPGVRHADDTGRLQSVTKAANPFFHDLLSKFYRKTEVPILLNTSFNVMGRPIVHDVEDTVGVFLTSDIDLLVLDDLVFQKPLDRKTR